MYKKEFLRDTSNRVSETYGVATISRILKNHTSLLHIIVSFTGMAENEDRKSKRPQNNQKTPETRNMIWGHIEDVYLKAQYTINANKISLF